MEHSSRGWQTRVRDMLTFCAKVLDYASGLKQDKFIANQLVYNTTLLHLVLIGEAANYVPKSIQEVHPNIPWRRIIGMRNRLIHNYWDIDNNIVWDAVQNKVPALVPALQHLLEAADNSNTQQ